MTTTAALIDETKRHLSGFQREDMNKLATPVPVNATSLTFAYDLNGIQAGAYLSVGLELYYVWQVEPSSKTAVVESAQLGSLSTAHDQGDIVTVNPRFPDFHILKALNDDLASLSSPMSGLFAMRSLDLTGRSAQNGYDLAGIVGELQDVYEVRYRNNDGTSGYLNDWTTVNAWELAREVNATTFPSGFALFIREGVPSGRQIRVRYRTGFAPLVTLADDVATVTGLPDSALDLPPLGAAMRLVAPREIKRNFTEAQGDARRAEEVGAGAVSASMRGVQQVRAMRLAEEQAKLARNFPQRFR